MRGRGELFDRVVALRAKIVELRERRLALLGLEDLYPGLESLGSGGRDVLGILVSEELTSVSLDIVDFEGEWRHGWVNGLTSLFLGNSAVTSVVNGVPEDSSIRVDGREERLHFVRDGNLVLGNKPEARSDRWDISTSWAVVSSRTKLGGSVRVNESEGDRGG